MVQVRTDSRVISSENFNKYFMLITCELCRQRVRWKRETIAKICRLSNLKCFNPSEAKGGGKITDRSFDCHFRTAWN